MDDQPTCEQLDIEALEALAADERAPLPDHVATCAQCQQELQWLRRERQLFAARRAAPPTPAPAFEAVAARIAVEAEARARKRRSRWLTFYSAVPAAAALSAALLLPRPRPEAPRGEPRDARLELQRAEREVSDAARVLEAKYRKRVAVLANTTAVAKLDSLYEARTQVLAARAQAGDDLEARQVALEGYSAYVRELHRVVAEMDQVTAQ